jgi:hypothetical protein
MDEECATKGTRENTITGAKLQCMIYYVLAQILRVDNDIFTRYDKK